jgi:hypothetical protein
MQQANSSVFIDAIRAPRTVPIVATIDRARTVRIATAADAAIDTVLVVEAGAAHEVAAVTDVVFVGTTQGANQTDHERRPYADCGACHSEQTF